MKILFLCVANSARSQLAHVLAQDIYKQLGYETNFIQSAGSMPSGKVNPLAVEVLSELGFSQAVLKQLKSNSIKELDPKFIKQLDYIITLCEDEVCPVLDSLAQKLHWPYPDPFTKQDFEVIAQKLQIRLKKFIDEEN